MSEDPLSPLWGVIICLGLILINAWFSAARKSISECNKTKIREMAEDGSKGAKKAVPILDKAPMYKLSLRTMNVLIGMLFCIVCIQFFGAPLYHALLDAWHTETGAMIVAFIVILFLALVFFLALGEMVPRRIAVLHAEGILMSTSGTIKALDIFLKPVTACSAGISFVCLKLLRQRADIDDNEYSEEDIVDMLEAGQESGELKEEGKRMITGVFAFDDILAYEIMTPRTDVFAIDIDDPPDEYIDELMSLKYSRIPVYEDDSDNIIGILNIKDYLIQARSQGFENVDIRAILRDPYMVPETKNIDSLFLEMQKTRQQIAILIDEYGGFCGIVTMEDIIEEVMGDIDDEYDEEEQELTEIGKDLYLIEGSMYLDDINEELGTNLESEDSETIGGFIIDMFGEIPDEDDIGKEIFFENFVFTINSVKDRRIEKVILKVNEKEEADKKDKE